MRFAHYCGEEITPQRCSAGFAVRRWIVARQPGHSPFEHKPVNCAHEAQRKHGTAWIVRMRFQDGCTRASALDVSRSFVEQLTIEGRAEAAAPPRLPPEMAGDLVAEIARLAE